MHPWGIVGENHSVFTTEIAHSITQKTVQATISSATPKKKPTKTKSTSLSPIVLPRPEGRGY
jgi:pyruvoyl-dependent arginine decarboxylase (PvlArgDC)